MAPAQVCATEGLPVPSLIAWLVTDETSEFIVTLPWILTSLLPAADTVNTEPQKKAMAINNEARVLKLG